MQSLHGLIDLMKRVVPLLLLLAGLGLPVHVAYAQPWVVTGFVLQEENDLPLPGATVALTQEETVLAGDVTDTTGYYRIEAPRPGTYVLQVAYLGFASAAMPIEIADDSLRRDFRLARTLLDPGLRVEVSAPRIQLPSDVAVSVTQVSAERVRTLAGGGEDVLQALRVFPGVQTSGDHSTQLYIRGGTPDQNLILIDDIEVFSPYQLSGMGSLLNPELVRDVELFAGTMPVEYGDRLSSALVVTTRDGRTDGRVHGRLNSTLMTINGTLEGSTGFWDGSWIASGRKTYFGSFANTFARRIGIFNEIAFPNFYDLHAKVTLRPHRHHLVRTTLLGSRDRLDWIVDEDALGTQAEGQSLQRGDRKIAHTAVGVQWSWIPDEQTRTRIYANVYRNEGNSGLGGGLQAWMGGLEDFDNPFGPPDPIFPSDVEAEFSQTEEYDIQRFSVGARGTLSSGRHTVEFGAGQDLLHTELNLTFDANEFAHTMFDAIRQADPVFSTFGRDTMAVKKDRRIHLFVQDKLALLNERLYLQPAVRYDYYSIVGEGHFTPRLAVSVPLWSHTTVRLAGGRFVQSPGLEKSLDPDDNFNVSRMESLAGLTVESAWHAGASVLSEIGQRWTVKLQAYRKWYDDLLTPDARVVERAVARYFPIGSPVEGRVGPLTPSAWIIGTDESPVLLPSLVNAGTGNSYGVEALVMRDQVSPNDKLSGWISYAYARADRASHYASGTIAHPFAYDRRHTVNAVMQWRILSSLTLGATWRYGTGFPYTPALRMQALVAEVEDPNVPGLTQDIVLVDPASGNARLVPSYGGLEDQFTTRYPDYHRLDLRLTYETTWQGIDVRVYGDMINLYNRKNVITYKYYVGTQSGEYDHLPIALRPPPIATLFREPIYGFPFIPSIGISGSF